MSAATDTTRFSKLDHWVITRRPGYPGKPAVWTVYGPNSPTRVMSAEEGLFLVDGAPAEYRYDWPGVTTWHLPFDWEPAGVETVEDATGLDEFGNAPEDYDN